MLTDVGDFLNGGMKAVGLLHRLTLSLQGSEWNRTIISSRKCLTRSDNHQDRENRSNHSEDNAQHQN
jgi:hypothetical protein